MAHEQHVVFSSAHGARQQAERSELCPVGGIHRADPVAQQVRVETRGKSAVAPGGASQQVRAKEDGTQVGELGAIICRKARRHLVLRAKRRVDLL